MAQLKKIKVIVSHPIQYHAVLWRNMAELDEVDFEVFFCSDHGQKISVDKDFGLAFKWDIPLKKGYKSKTFKNYGFGNGFFKYINPGLIISIFFSRSQIVYFHGVSNFTAYFSFWISKFKGAKTIVRNIAHLLDFSNTKGIRFALKDFIFGSIFRKASVCLYIGKHNKDFYKFFGVKESRLKHAPHLVDNQFFQERKLSLIESQKFKADLGIKQDEVVLLFCGKLIAKKQPDMLLEAYLKSDLNVKSTLLFVGEGVLRDKLEILAKNIIKEENKSVKFLGFKNQSELPAVYCISDILVLPSYHQETWGLVVNEALNFNTTIIVSDNVGCGPELVEGKTGFIFERNSKEKLQEVLERLVNETTLREKYKLNTLSLISNWGIRQFINSIKRIINE
ncbi:MAG: glycosyltransferase family 4 protein [Vicingaceae bacterium]